MENEIYIASEVANKLKALSPASRMKATELINSLSGNGWENSQIVVPDAILYKPGKLTAEEWVVMKTHSVRGEEICRPMHSLAAVLPIIRNHHERWDGSGYPDGLQGEQIPLLARVLQLADAFDALCSVRPYKDAFPRELTIQTLLAEGEMGWRDRELTRLFTELPFDELKLAEEQILFSEKRNDFDSSIRNLQEHLAMAS